MPRHLFQTNSATSPKFQAPQSARLKSLNPQPSTRTRRPSRVRRKKYQTAQLMELWPSVQLTSSGMCLHTGSSVVFLWHGTRHRLITSRAASKERQGSRTSNAPRDSSRMLDWQTGGLGFRIYCTLQTLCVTTKVSTTRPPHLDATLFLAAAAATIFATVSLVSFSSSLARLFPCSVGACTCSALLYR